MSKILVVDDEPDIVDLVSLHLEREGHEALAVGDGRDIVPAAAQCEPDLILLDLALPGINGIEAYKLLRADPRTRDIPVIILTARTQMSERIAGLECGADDYLTKPVSMRELMLRINLVLRRSKRGMARGGVERIGPFRLDRKNMALTLDGKLVNLTITELKLLTILMDHADETCPRQELLSQVWGHADGSHSRTLDTHVKRLRVKLGRHGGHIRTEHGLGYSLRSQADGSSKSNGST